MKKREILEQSILSNMLMFIDQRKEDCFWQLDTAMTKETIKSFRPTDSNVKINLLDVEEALGKDTIVAINTRVKKDKRTTMFKKALNTIKALDNEHCNITYIGTDSGYALNSQGDTELDGSFTITITGNKTK